MPVYEYYCEKCEREVQLTLSMCEHDKGSIKCPKCSGKALRPLLTVFPVSLSRLGFGHARQSSVKDDSPKYTDSALIADPLLVTSPRSKIFPWSA